MDKKSYRVRNWRDYNKSLTHRGSITFWFCRDIVDNWQFSDKNFAVGHPKIYSDMAITCALTLRQLYRLPLRATQGLMTSLVELAKLHLPIPNYSTLSRRAGTLSIKLDRPRDDKPLNVLVDSTGVQVIGEGEWKILKHGLSRCQVWKKLHISMDADSQMILSATVTDSVRLDGNYLKKLLDDIKGPIESVTGDGAYDKKPCYEAIYQRQAKAVIPPQHNACVQRNKINKNPALLVRDAAIASIGRGEHRIDNLKAWKLANHYHKRSLVETMMSRMKTIFGDRMRSRTFANQQTDLLLRCKVINQFNQLGLPVSVCIN